MRIRRAVTMTLVAASCAALAAATAGCAAVQERLFRQYEYDEEVYLSLDGSAVVFVNSSIAALNALRGASLDVRPNVAVDRAAVTAFFSSPVTTVTSVGTFRRAGRRFVRVRLEVPSIRRLSEAPAFAWSTYELQSLDDGYRFRQTVGAAAGKEVGQAGWTGAERVAFRLHLPSRITFHNTAGGPEQGNILRWEQLLTDRLRGVPLGTLEARMEPESILKRTLWLFGSTAVAVALTFVFVIWWLLRRNVTTAEV